MVLNSRQLAVGSWQNNELAVATFLNFATFFNRCVLPLLTAYCLLPTAYFCGCFSRARAPLRMFLIP
jgi:hypothetical protein